MLATVHPKSEGPRPVSLSERLRHLRESAGLSLDELADKAKISKTYLWELEKDKAGEKKPSADVLLRIASAYEAASQRRIPPPAFGPLS